jgi:hypothetical protein
MREVSNEVLVRYLQGEMTKSESDETERLIADSRRAQVRLAELREMTEALRRPPDWVASADLTSAVASRVREVEPSAPARRPRRALWLASGTALLAAAAILLVAAPWRSGGGGSDLDAEPRAKGGAAADPDRWVGISLATADRQPIGDTLPSRGEIMVSYTNLGPEPYSHLMVFALDGSGEVRWFYPAWQDEAANPAAVPIEPGVADRVLPDLVEHTFTQGDGVVVFGLFLRRPLTVREVEAALAGKAFGARSRLPFPDSGQHWLAKRVK